MKRVLSFIIAVSFAMPSLVKADEGMWLPLLVKRLNHTDMQAKGLQLTAEEIYSVNNSSLKDAIVSLGGFCTAEVVSGKGLLLTNHHCAYGSIQEHSTVENDYLSDGFWARSLEEEKINKDLFARFLIRMEDVTNDILANITSDMTEAQRKAKIKETIDALKAKATEGSHYKAVIKDFFYGNEYYMFIYEDFNDVRLVGAPPSSIGKYGGDTDNWMWPRHTGDFSLMRVYSAPDGMPAAPSEENVPLTPKHHLPISIAGVNNGDFAMIMGYPGSTDRFLSSWGVEDELDNHQPTVVEIRDEKLRLMKEYMDADPAVRIQYAAKYAQVANYWKYYIGQQKQLKRNKVLDKKRALEADFKDWIEADSDRFEKYGEALSLIQEGIEGQAKFTKANTYLLEAGLTGSNLVLFAFRTGRMIQAGMGDEAKMNDLKAGIEKAADKHFAETNLALDKEMMKSMLKMYKSNVDASQLPEIFTYIDDKFKGDIDKFVEKLYDKSIYASKENLMAFLNKPSEKTLEKDLGAMLATEMIQKYFASQGANGELAEKEEKGYRLFVDGLRKMQADKKFYPNANSTMRLTYGTVGDYKAADAVHYDYETTLEGVMEKMDNSNPEFEVPAKLVELYEAKDYGRYANEDGELVVNFITNNDITGGNSGSPVINAKGEYIGSAFDGNWEAMSGDIAFETEIQRTIVVDARYVLFIIDKFAGAQNLIDEMTITSTPVNAVEMVETEGENKEEANLVK